MNKYNAQIKGPRGGIRASINSQQAIITRTTDGDTMFHAWDDKGNSFTLYINQATALHVADMLRNVNPPVRTP